MNPLRQHLDRHAQHFLSFPNWETAWLRWLSSFRISLSYLTAPQKWHLCRASSQYTTRVDVVAIYPQYIVDTGQCQHIEMSTHPGVATFA